MTGTVAKAYHKKQRECLQGHVNLVEIDVIREGQFVLAVPESHLPPKCRTPYRVCVRRVTRPEIAEVHAVSLRDPLPNIAIPLRPTDRDVVLQLQPLFDECYRRGRYHRRDYRQPLDPPLAAEDAAWVTECLRQKGLA